MNQKKPRIIAKLGDCSDKNCVAYHVQKDLEAPVCDNCSVNLKRQVKER